MPWHLPDLMDWIGHVLLAYIAQDNLGILVVNMYLALMKGIQNSKDFFDILCYYLFVSLATMPDFMKNADRIVGGEAAPSMIPWQVAMLSGSFQFCGGTVLDSCTILTAAHCGINTGHSIRAGSLTKTSGGQVCQNIRQYLKGFLKFINF